MRFQDFVCLGTLFLFALVSANTQNIPLQEGDSTGSQLLQKITEQAELMEAERQFYQFQKDFQKNYATEQERQRRFAAFRNNMKKVKEMNELEQGTAVYGATIFADLTLDELPTCQGGCNFTSELGNNLPMAAIQDTYELPKEFDWRLRNVVTPVKNSLGFGTCWAFAVTGNVESQYAIHHKELLNLSEQQLLDCVDKNKGHKGGIVIWALDYLLSVGGLELAKDYPYVGKKKKCKFKEDLVKARYYDYCKVNNNELAIAKDLVEFGPISVLINSKATQGYIGGVSKPPASFCDPKKLNHAAMIVGFGEEQDPKTGETLPYWIIKNNWGSKWGEKGYFRLHRGSGACGIDRWPFFINIL